MSALTPRNLRFWALVWAVAAGVGLPRAAKADTTITVGFGTPGSCTELTLRTALMQAAALGGANIRFACGAAPMTILLTQLSGSDWPVFLEPSDNTTLDGGGLITLRGEPSAATVLFITANTTVALKNIGITGAWGYSAVHNEGNLDVRQAHFYGNSFNAIDNRGSLTVRNSLFTDNGNFLSAPGGAISNFGTATVESSAFLDNGGDGGAVFNSGTLSLKNSTFTGNHAEWFAGGMTSYGVVGVEKCRFFSNSGFAGGAISNHGSSLTVKNSKFIDNAGISPGAGGITSWSGEVIIDNAEFLSNYGTYAGGIYSGTGSSLRISNTLLDGNRARYGGGLTLAGQTTIVNSTIIRNWASLDGGGIYVQGDALPLMVRTSVTDNTPNDIVIQP